MLFHPNIRRCEHIKIDGTQCGSPALRKNTLCYFHRRWREQRIALKNLGAPAPSAIDLPVLEDATSIQVGIMQVIRLLLTGQLEHKTAALLLSGLRTASSNLRNARFQPFPPQVVIDPATVDQTRMGEHIWNNSDFNVVEELDGEEDADDEQEDDPGKNDGVKNGDKDNGAQDDCDEPQYEENEPDELKTGSLAEIDRRTPLEKAYPSYRLFKRIRSPAP